MTGAVTAAASSGGTTTLDVVIIVLAIAVGAFIKGATGGGLPQVAIPVMAPFIGVEHAVVIMALPGIVSNAWLAYHHREEYPRTRDLPSLVWTGVVGAVVGTVALKSLDGRALSAALVVVIVAYVVVVLVHPGFHLPARVTRVASPPVGLAGGVLQGSTGISGPLLTTYLHGFQLLPKAYIFSLAVLFGVGAVVQAITLAAVGLYTGSRLVESLLILLPIAALQPVGSWAATRLSRTTFQRVTLVLVAASAVSLAHNVVTGG
jgi:uncharacterized membrane protein YfcA